MTKIILLNGPPRVGKGTAAKLLMLDMIQSDCNVEATIIGFSYWLKTMVHTIYLGKAGALMDPEVFDSCKDEPIAVLGGRSWRWAYQYYSEHVIKPLHGKEWFGERFVESVRASKADVVYVPDSGFVSEAERVVREFSPDNVTLFRLHREGFDFRGDTRGYISLDHVGVPATDITNITNHSYAMVEAMKHRLQAAA